MVSQEKQRLRQQFRRQRRSLTGQQRSAKERALNDLFLASCGDYFPEAKQLFGYLPIDGEPCLALDGVGYQTALPVVRQRLLFCRWRPGEPLCRGRFTEEPSVWQPVVADSQTLVVVPCVAVDRSGYRLGFGKGFYDRFLADNQQAITIGVCFSEFVIDNLPCESHDQAVEYLLTDKCFSRTLTAN